MLGQTIKMNWTGWEVKSKETTYRTTQKNTALSNLKAYFLHKYINMFT